MKWEEIKAIADQRHNNRDKIDDLIACLFYDNHFEKIAAVVDAAKSVAQYDAGDGGSRLILECDLQRLDSALEELEK